MHFEMLESHFAIYCKRNYYSGKLDFYRLFFNLKFCKFCLCLLNVSYARVKTAIVRQRRLQHSVNHLK